MPISYQQWIAALKQHAIVSIAAFLVVISLTIAMILFAPRSYSSEAKLMLRIGRESVSIDPMASSVGEKLSLQNTRDNEIQSAVGLMHSRQIVENVVNDIGEDVILNGKPKVEGAAAGSPIGNLISSVVGPVKGMLGSIDPVPENEKAIRELHDGVYIGSTKDSSVVSVAYTTKSPEVARDVVSSWVKCFIDQHAEANHTQRSLGFFIEQGKIIREQLESARLALENAKNDSNLVSIEGQQGLLEGQLSKVRDSLLNVDSELAAANARVESYDQILNDNDAMITSAVTGKNNEARDLMRDQLFELEVTEKNLESKYKDGHPRLVAIRNQLSDARNIVTDLGDSRDEITRSINPVYQQVSEKRLLAQAELKAYAQKRATLDEKSKLLESEISDLNRTERKVRSLESEVEILQDRYAGHSVKMEQSRMDDVLADERITSVNVVQPAIFQMRPVSPDKPLCLAAGLLAASALALSLPVLIETRKEHLNRTAIGELAGEEWEFAKRERVDAGHTDAVPDPQRETVS